MSGKKQGLFTTISVAGSRNILGGATAILVERV
jgi:hypothetical protein